MSTKEQLQQAPAPPPTAALVQMATGHMVSQAIYVAAKLGIADQVSGGRKTAEELARAVDANPSALYRLLRMLTTLGVFREEAKGRFGQTALSTCLETSHSGSLRNAVILWNEEQYRAWGALLHSVKTGEIAFNHVFGSGWFPYLEEHAEAAAVFNAAMTEWIAQAAAAVTHAYDFSGMGKVVDVGGGHGIMLTSILNAFPGLSGVLFETPSVVSGAKQSIDAANLSRRCDVVGGDFFTEVPSGGDAYILAQVLHDWDDEQCLVILKNCHRAMADRAKLLVVETVLSSEADSSLGTLSDLHMLVVLGGRERTASEYRDLFARSGFELARIIPMRAPQSIIEGIRV